MTSNGDPIIATRAHWVWEEDLDCWMPVCATCGNGPLTGEDIVTGDCGDKERHEAFSYAVHAALTPPVSVVKEEPKKGPKFITAPDPVFERLLMEEEEIEASIPGKKGPWKLVKGNTIIGGGTVVACFWTEKSAIHERDKLNSALEGSASISAYQNKDNWHHVEHGKIESA